MKPLIRGGELSRKMPHIYAKWKLYSIVDECPRMCPNVPSYCGIRGLPVVGTARDKKEAPIVLPVSSECH